jgi:hypothetical protein
MNLEVVDIYVAHEMKIGNHGEVISVDVIIIRQKKHRIEKMDRITNRLDFEHTLEYLESVFLTQENYSLYGSHLGLVCSTMAAVVDRQDLTSLNQDSLLFLL